MRWLPVSIVVIVTLTVVIVLGMGFGTDPHAVPSVLAGKPAPDCTLSNLEGEPLTIADLRGKPVLLNFWSTWCVPCKTEHALLQQAAKAYGEKVEFIGVVYQDTADKARAYLSRLGSEYGQYIDPDSKCAIDYGVAGVPETFFINPQGIVSNKQVGPVTPSIIRDNFRLMFAKAKP